MRIAILGSVVTQIPPSGQAAIETLVYEQALGLAKKGHKILLFAPKGSKVEHPNVEIVEIGSGGTLSGAGKESGPFKGSTLRAGHSELNLSEEKYGSSYKLRLEITNLGVLIKELLDRKDQYDVVLNNLRGEAVVVPVLNYLQKPMAHVMHLPLFDELSNLFKIYNTPLISISNAQRKAYQDLNYVATVYNGVDPDVFTFNETPEDYYLYLGSIGKNKNPKDALIACKETGVKLVVGGRVKDKEYYEKEISPLVDGTRISWVGELDPQKVRELYQRARAFLFPTLWAEPFGLVLIESMSCGTPVIAYPNGAVPEVIKNGYNGYLVNNVGEMKTKILEIEKMGLEVQKLRQNARKSVEEKFTVGKMVEGYEEVLANLKIKN